MAIKTYVIDRRNFLTYGLTTWNVITLLSKQAKAKRSSVKVTINSINLINAATIIENNIVVQFLQNCFDLCFEMESHSKALDSIDQI